MKFISSFLAPLCFLASCSQSPDESPQLSQESIVGVWRVEYINRKVDEKGFFKFFSDGTGEFSDGNKTGPFKWSIDTSNKLSEWYDDSASKPTSLTVEMKNKIGFAMYEVSESGTLKLGIDRVQRNHILQHEGILLGKRVASKEVPH